MHTDIKARRTSSSNSSSSSSRSSSSSSDFIPNRIQQYNTIQYSVHDYHNQQQSDHRYCYVIMLVATREAMGLSGWHKSFMSS